MRSRPVPAFAPLLLVVIAIALVARPASAGDTNGLSANAALVFDTVGVRHAIDGQPDTFVAPLPFFSGEVKYRRVSVDALGLSTFGTLDFAGQKTGLALVAYTARYTFLRNAYAGVGITSLNQQTGFEPQTVTQRFGPTGTEAVTERSHLYGVRYELGFTERRMQVDLGLTPRIYGTVFDHCVATFGAVETPCTNLNDATVDGSTPENATEFDADYRYFIPISKRIDAIAGLRYIDSSAASPTRTTSTPTRTAARRCSRPASALGLRNRSDGVPLLN